MAPSLLQWHEGVVGHQHVKDQVLVGVRSLAEYALNYNVTCFSNACALLHQSLGARVSYARASVAVSA